MRLPRFGVRGFRSARELVGTSLGPLERRVMDVLWARPEASVRDVCAHVGPGTAYTTLETTLDRLFKKGLLLRRKVGRAFVYRPAASRDDLERMAAADLVEGLFKEDRRAPLPLLSNLVDAVGERDRELLDELELMVRLKQEELRKREAR